MYVKGIFPSERKLVRYNSRGVPMLTIRDLPGEYKDKDDKAQDVMMTKGKAPNMMHVVRQANILP